jgi:hypothetical protein
MFKHPKCGGTHETVAQARTCEQGGGVATMERHERQFTVNGGENPAEPRYVLPASQERHSINAPRRGYVRLASPGAEKYVRDLLAKKAWQGVTSQQADEIINKIGSDAKITADEASYLIDELKPMDYRQDTTPAPSSQGTPTRGQWAEAKRLKAQVPDGRYAVDLPGEHKVKFFRLRTNPANGYFRITHVVSDDRFPWPVKRYAEVLQAIIAATPAAAGLRYAEEYGKCFNCGRALTDTDNPYKPYGLGPDCGPKRMG